ncbi:hypothetical protein ACFVKB_05050 [Rhodococcus sp. NPDC127530]|uniref:hypothetical protein n=1 Tax=unclassified Rhodococcus (in: high G+C Gram-positive bacteria) TaxID=192944 RepID=UPI00364119FA
MARVADAPKSGGRREFTRAERDRIRELTSRPLPPVHRPGRSGRQIEAELDAIHAAAGRVRRFKLWPLGGGEHDPEAAYAEELDG